MPHGCRWPRALAACAVLAACSSEPEPLESPESPDELAETRGELQRGPETMVYDRGWRVDQHPRFVTDLNQDRRGDLIGFGDEGVYVAEALESGGYGPTALAIPNLGRHQNWSVQAHVRTLADVNGDGRPDVVGFGHGAVWVALKLATGGYGAATPWLEDFSTQAGWTAAHARLVGDVTGDGKADLVGINDWGVYVSPSTGSGFAAKQLWLRDFAPSNGWDSSRHPRLLVDVNGDGLADLVGFGEHGVWVSRSNGARFSDIVLSASAFGHSAGWRLDAHLRAVVNLNGDRFADLLGLGPNGVHVALGNATGFDAPVMWPLAPGNAASWIAAQQVRLIGDVDGDGRDDVVGIGDDRVQVARNTGSGFALLDPVTDFFTPAQGWENAKHPRHLTDVDGDGQLDLLGFGNDAVYWSRLTPVASIPPDWTTPTCAASRLAPPAPGYCEGPWRYTKTHRAVSQHPSCPKVCAASKSCAKWENGLTTATSTEATSIAGTGDRLCTRLCNSSGCHATACSGTMTQPTAACQAAASSRQSALRIEAASAVAAEPSFDSAAAQAQRSHEAQSAATATAGYVVRQYDTVAVPGPGGTHTSWREEWRCQLSITKPSPRVAANEACGCATQIDGTCEHDEGAPSTLFTAPGALRPAAPGIANQECLTYDDLPAATPAQVQAKFEALWNAQTIAPTTVTGDQLQRALVNRMKLVYELWGDQLVDQHTSTDQVHRAISLYQTFPEVTPSCAVVDAPAPPASCTMPSVTATRGDLIRCQRLLAPHASERVASLASTACTALLHGYLDLAARPPGDTRCEGPHLRKVAAQTVLQLADKQLGVIASAPSTLGALPRQLWLLDGWYQVSKRADEIGVFAEPDQQRRDTSYLLGRFWDRLRARSGADEMLAELSESSTPDQAEQALGLSAVTSRQSDQDVVSALFTSPGLIQPENVTLNRPPLRSLPLLAMLGDALKPLTDDLDGLAIYHDIACTFRDCRAPTTSTPSRAAWRILAALESPSFGPAVAASQEFALGGWTPVFGKLAHQQAALTAAIADAVVEPGGLGGATEEAAVHPLARPLWLLHRHARGLHAHYEATGLFDPTAQNRLLGSVLQAERVTVVSGLRERADRLGATVTQYRNGLIAALQAQLAVMDTGARITDLTTQRLRKATEMRQKIANAEGLRASGEDQAYAFASLASSFADVQAALDDGAVVQVGDTVTFELDGRAGRFTGSSTPSSVAAHTVPGLQPGELLLVQTSGSWTPTCSIGTKRWLTDQFGTTQSADLSNAAIGPEGYSLSISDTDVDAVSAARSRDTTTSMGVSFRLCADSGVLGDIYGVTPELCVHTDTSTSASTAWSSSTGNESRRTAAFATGLRLDDTPFPDAPVGSLLVVLVDPATGAIRDVRTVHSGSTSIVIEGPSTAYFVANDRQCHTAATVNKLSVTYRPVRSAVAVAEQALVAMADVLGLMRQQQEALAAQGTMLPNQATLLRQHASLRLQQRLGEIGATELPAPLISLFDAFVSHEIVATERRIEIAAVLRSLELDLLEMRMIDDELTAGAARARLQRLVPQWLLRDLDHDHLRGDLVDLLSVSRDYLRPILDLWYPTALGSVSVGPEIHALISADVGTSLVSLANAGQAFVYKLLDAYATAVFGAKPNAPELPLVVLSFPRPGFEPTNEFWREADAARSQRVWDAIDRHTVAHFEITPEDIYARSGGDAVLPCTEVVPVIKTMAFHVVRESAGDNGTLNDTLRWFGGHGGANQSFVTPEGPRLYQLADPVTGAASVWQSFSLLMRYGASSATIPTFRAAAHQTRPLGLSATGSFEVDFSALDTIAGAAALGADNPVPATEIQLVLELDSRASSTRPTWITRCR